MSHREIAKVIRPWLAAAAEQGWRVVEIRDGVKLLSPDGKQSVVIHHTPSDHRWAKNRRAALRRGGLQI